MLKFLKGRKLRRYFAYGAVLAILLVVTGCRTIGFYTQAAKGQFKLLAARESIAELQSDDNTSPVLKQQFQVLAELRTFAENELSLPTDGHYQKYADLHRPFVLWNIEAAPEFSMKPKRWWYPLVGKQKYRGYFNQSAATNYARELRASGYDVFVGGVQAYSTLGFFKDIALNTFMFDPDPALAELIFHELSHQQVFARGDTDFNEAFATTVGQEGARRWLKAHRPPEMLQAYETELRREEEFVAIVAQARRELEALYGDKRDKEGELVPNRNKVTDPEKLRRQKKEIFERMRQNYEKLKATWNGGGARDMFFELQLNNAKLNSIANYHDLVPGFRALLQLTNGNLKEFYSAAERLAKMPKKDRREWLHTLDVSSNESVTNLNP